MTHKSHSFYYIVYLIVYTKVYKLIWNFFEISQLN